jgi:hypothetical protein
MGEWDTRCLTHQNIPRATHRVGYSLEWDSIPLATRPTHHSPNSPVSAHVCALSAPPPWVGRCNPRRAGPAARAGRPGTCRRRTSTFSTTCTGLPPHSLRPGPYGSSGLFCTIAAVYLRSVWFQTCSDLPGTKPRNPTEQIRLLRCVWHCGTSGSAVDRHSARLQRSAEGAPLSARLGLSVRPAPQRGRACVPHRAVARRRLTVL